ncbi:MAG: hypothetical protein QNJ47_15095 [Nostocaceae cyanobacterium]|nr:hypothetical protein [Nostocaceae cyanobacterium]
MFPRLFVVTSGLACLSLLVTSMNVTRGDTNNHNHTGHTHEMMEIPQGQPVPSVDLVVHPDAKKGWNLEAKVSNFRFAPENVNKGAKPGEGHGHIYVNGKKITRIYDSWYYLESLPLGKNRVTVSLNANNHAALAVNGKLIEDTEIIEVPKATHSQTYNK